MFPENDVLPPGHEVKPSGFEEYLEQHSEKPWKLLSEAPYQPGDKLNFSSTEDYPDKRAVNIMYDIPYEPTEKFDMSEADFAPSPTAGKRDYTGTSIYDFHKETESDSHINSDYLKLGVNKNLQNEYDLSKTEALNSNFVKNDLQSGSSIQLPVQAADLSPDKIHPFQLNGHATDSELYLPKQNNVAVTQDEPVIQPLTLSSLSSTQSDRTGSDTDKAPIECNTPSTPYENVYVNPFDSQLKLKVRDIPDSDLNSEVHSSGSAHSSHNELKTDTHSDIRNEILAQNQSLSNNDSNDSHFSSLPANSGQPNPASQFHSLPPTLGFQTSMKEINQNDYQNSDMETKALKQYEPIVEKINTETVEPPKIVSYQEEVRKPYVQQTQVCSFNDDVELSENDLDDYLGNENDTDITGTDVSSKDLPVKEHNVVDTNLVQDDTNFEHSVISNFDTLNSDKDYDSKTERTDGTELTDNKPQVNVVEIDNVPKLAQTIDSTRDELDIHRNKQLEMHIGGQTDEILTSSKRLTENQQVHLETETRAKDQVFPQTITSDMGDSVKLAISTSSFDGLNLVSNTEGLAQETVIPRQNGMPEIAEVGIDNGATNTDNSYVPTGTIADSIDIDVMPKDTQGKNQRPSSLTGLSVVNLNSESPFVVREDTIADNSNQSVSDHHESVHSHKDLDIVSRDMINVDKEKEGRQLMDSDQAQKLEPTNVVNGVYNNAEGEMGEFENEDAGFDEEIVELRQTQLQPGENGPSERPQSWGPTDTGQPQTLKQKRPTSLNLPPRPEFNTQTDESSDQSPEETGASGEDLNYTGQLGYYTSGPGCSKLTTSLVNVSLKFQMLIS